MCALVALIFCHSTVVLVHSNAVCKLRAVINLHGLYGLCSVLLRTSQMTVHVCSIALSRYIILQTFVAVIVHFFVPNMQQTA